MYIRITASITSSTDHDNADFGGNSHDGDAILNPCWFADISVFEGLANCTNKKKLHEYFVGLLLVDDVEDDEGNLKEEARIVVGIEWRRKLKNGDGEPLPNQYFVVQISSTLTAVRKIWSPIL